MDGHLTLRLRAVDDGVQVTLDKVGGAATRTNAALNGVGGASNTADAGLRKVKGAAGEASGALDQLASDARKGIVAFAGFEVLKDVAAGVIDASRKMAGFRNTMEAATGSVKGAQDGMAFVRAESERLGTSLEDNAGSFAKLSAATRGTSLAGRETQRIFTAVSEAARVMHLSAEQTNGALLALQQMVSKGTVQAEELRGQLGERLPGAFQIASQAMGVTTAQLGKMLEAGQVTANDLLPKLATQLHALYGAQAEVAASTPVAQMQRLSNAVFELKAAIGEAGFMDALAGAAVRLTNAITALTTSGGLSILLQMLEAIGAAIALNLGSRVVTATATYVQGIMAARAATIQQAQATATAAAALVEHTAAQGRDAAAQAVAINAARTAAATRLEAANASIIEAQRTIVATEAIGAQSAALAANKVAQAELLVAQQARSASMTELVALGRAQIAVEGQLAAASAAQITAVGAAAAAQRGLATATSLTSMALSGLASVGRTLFALIGGWPGLLIAAGAAIYYLAQQTTPLEDAANDAAAATRNLASATGEQRSAALQAAEANAAKKDAMLAEAEASLHAATAATAHMNATHADAAAFRNAHLADQIDGLKASIAGLREEIRKTRIAEIMEGFERGPQEVAAFVKEQRDAVGQTVAGFARMTAELEKQAATYGKGKVALVEYERAEAIAKISTALSADEQARLRKEIEDGTAKAMAAAKTYDATTAAKKADRDATRALREEMSELNASGEAENSVLNMLDSLSGGLSAAAAVQSEFDRGIRDLQRDMEKWAENGGDVNRIIGLWQKGEDLLRQNMAKANAELLKRNQLTNGNRDLVESLARQTDVLGGLDDAQVQYNAGVREANQLVREANELGLDAAQVQQGLEDRLAKLLKMRDAVSLDKILGEFAQVEPFTKLIEEIGKVQAALETATDPKIVERLQQAMGNLRQTMVDGIVTSSQQGLKSLQSMASSGSKAFQAMQVAIDALTVVQAISAVLNQAQGDPYTAFARMAAMAAAVAALGVSIGNFAGGGGGPSSASAEVRQRTQGTGSVLGDATAKSESIARATEITASATTQLVGLNRGMLNALQALQSALGAAGNQLARGAGDVAFPGVGAGFNLDIFGGDPLTGAISNFLFGGSKKVIDQGIVIAGGTLQEMLNQIVVGAYRTIHRDGGLFGSDRTYDQIEDISGSFGKEFQLVIASIAETVRQGALALGLLPADVEAAIAQFRVEEIRISLKGLSAEDQQKELEAVFSKIFDDLAGAVVPFIDEFQQVGEGLGETLVRIATEVQVTQEAFRQLGIAVDMTDPKAFAELADGLVQAAGGLDAFMSQFQSFVANFAPEGHQLAVAGDALTKAFDEVGLELPATREGLWELAQGLDLSTESGRKQLATILRLADTADAYYDGLEDQAKTLLEAQQTLDDMGIGNTMSDFAKQLLSIAQAADKAMDAANTLAKAQGLEGASAFRVAQIHAWVARQVSQAIEALRAQTMDLISQLYGGTPGTLDETNRRIQAAGGDVNYGLPGYQSNDPARDVQNVGRSIQDTIQKWADGIKRVRDFLDSMLLNERLTTLTPQQQLGEAQRQFEAALRLAMGGDADALAQLPDLAGTYLDLARGFFSSGDQYTAIFEAVRQALGGLPGTAPGAGNNPPGSAGNPFQVGPSPELLALYNQRDALLASQEAANRLALATQLAQHLNDLAGAINQPVLALAQSMGVDLTKLATDLGVNLDEITGASVEALATMASLLGVSLTDLTEALGLSLTDLGSGVTELAESVGIDLTNLTVQTTEQLADLARSLGVDVTELAESVGIDLGNLADTQSLLNQALHDQIDGLPTGIQDQLGPLLKAVEDATTEADANAAINTLEDAVNELSPDIRDQLAPYLEGVAPSASDPDVRELMTANTWLQQILSETKETTKAVNSLGYAMDLPGYAVGTSYVPRDGLAFLHRGEKVLDPTTSAMLDRYGIQVTGGGGGSDAMVAEVRSLRLQQAQESDENARGLAAIADRLESVEAAQRELAAAQDRLANQATFANRS